jgi:hypothetical protein
MAVLKHRIFNADRFIDKFAEHEPVLAAHMNRWPTLVCPNPLTTEAFKDYLKTPPANSTAFEDMVEGLYQAYDFCNRQGYELLNDAIEINQLQLPGLHDIPKEVLALRLQTEDPGTFALACDMLFAAQVDKFVTYKGREPRVIEDVAPPLATFRAKLGEYFATRKGSDKIVIKHFADGTAHNFIVYHERRVTAELEIKQEGTTTTVTSRKFRPVRQDFIAYYGDTGRLEIETPIQKERDLMRVAFATSFFNEEAFFSGTNSEVAIKLEKLREPGFAFSLDTGHGATLKEITFKLPQLHSPSFSIRSKDAFSTLALNQMRQALAGAEIKSAVISISFGAGTRAKRVTLTHTNSLSFSRATHVTEVFSYLRRWQLLVD